MCLYINDCIFSFDDIISILFIMPIIFVSCIVICIDMNIFFNISNFIMIIMSQ